MKKIIIIVLLAAILFFVEFFWFNFIGKDFVPNLLLLLVVFIALNFGKYHALWAALVAGFIKDSFSIHPVEINMFSFLACALFISYMQKYIFHEFSWLTQVLIVCLVCLFNFIVQYALQFNVVNLSFLSAVRYVLLPEMVMTVLLSIPIFKQLKKCALKLSV